MTNARNILKSVRRRIFEIIEPAQDKDHISSAYDYIMIASIILGVIPLMFLEQTETFILFDKISFAWFLMDYLLRWLTADFHSKRKGIWAFLAYPFTLGAIVDLLSILPTLLLFISPTFKLLRMSRLLKLFRMSRLLRYYEPMQIILKVLRNEAPMLLSVIGLAMLYIFVTALIMFNVESGIVTDDGVTMFSDIFDAIYWSACTLTTVGYGDIHPVSPLGRIISMVSAIVGIAIVALPSGIITGGYMEELRRRQEQKQHNKE